MTRPLLARVKCALFGTAFALAVLGVGETALRAQPPAGPSAEQTLKARVERQYEVLPLHNGLLLRTRNAKPPRSIELSDSRIAVDGAEVTGVELRRQLGSDADLVLQLSYLDPPAQRALFGIAAQTETPAPVAAPPRSDAGRDDGRRGRRSGALVRFGSDALVGPDEVITDDLVVIGGTARVEGEVEGDVVAIGGRVELGPRAHVRRDVTVVGGTLQRDPGAVVDGTVNDVGTGAAILGRSHPGRVGFADRTGWLSGMRPLLGFVGTSMRLAVLILLGCVFVLVAPNPLDRVGERALAQPFKAGLIGLLLELAFIPALIVTIVGLVVTIVGIPLLALVPLALLAAVVALLFGFTAVTGRVGKFAAARFGWSSLGPYALTAIGIAIVFAPLVLSRIVGVATGGFGLVTIPLTALGVILEYLAWTIGLGAAALNRFRPASVA